MRKVSGNDQKACNNYMKPILQFRTLVYAIIDKQLNLKPNKFSIYLLEEEE